MALNIPNIGNNGTALLQGLQTGGDLYSKYMLPILEREKMAQLAQQQSMANKLRPSGDVANAAYISQLEAKLGPNHPDVISAKKAHALGMQNRNSLIDWRTMATNLGPYKASTPFARTVAEGQGNGPLDKFGPGSTKKNENPNLPEGSTKVGEQYYNKEGNPIYPSKTPIQKAYEQKIAKDTTDAFVRNKLPYAEMVETTFSNLVPEDLTTFSGPKGSAEWGIESIKAGLGNPSDRFVKWNNAVNTASALSKQLRQFWGDSIQPTAVERIDSLTNPSAWYKDPKVAISQLNQLKKITDQELNIFRKRGESPIRLGTKIDYKDGQFSVSKDKNQADLLNSDENKNKQSSENGVSSGMPKEEETHFLKAISSQLIQVMPNATPDKIKQTAITTGKSIEQVTDELLQLRDRIMEQKNGR